MFRFRTNDKMIKGFRDLKKVENHYSQESISPTRKGASIWHKVEKNFSFSLTFVHKFNNWFKSPTIVAITLACLHQTPG